jgi:hypothetical protein
MIIELPRRDKNSPFVWREGAGETNISKSVPGSSMDLD